MDSDFHATAGREFCEILSEVLNDWDISAQDCLDPLFVFFGKEFCAGDLRAVSGDDLAHICAQFNSFFEVDIIGVNHIKSAISKVLWHYSS